MTPKRSWEEDHTGADSPERKRRQSSSTAFAGESSQQHNGTHNNNHNNSSSASASGADAEARAAGEAAGQSHVPMISRKVKACAACRKHKIKCIMDDSGPPCRRCTEKGLGCVLNKSLQTLISERSQSSEAMTRDLEMLHSGVQSILKALNLPAMGTLQSAKDALHTPVSEEPPRIEDEVGPSCDNSPRMSPANDNDLPNVPIQSVYHLTKLSALRSPDTQGADAGQHGPHSTIDDFIAKGAMSIGDAERLYRLYMDQLDPFIYGVGGRYKTLDLLRRSSKILTVSVLTVAALHDSHSNGLYSVCSKEFKRVFSASIFSRNIDRDYLRAMCIASYWLSDLSWMLSGHAIRRAAEFNLVGQYRRAITDHSEEAADYVRIWYTLYICDQHLSTLFARQSVIREDAAIQGWETFIQLPIATDEDKRLASQVALLNIMHSIRDLFGPDTGDQVPQVYLMQIASFARQLDQWVGQWSTQLVEYHDSIRTFPRKGVLTHFHFAKLQLYSHVFRGLRNGTIPSYFMDCAHQAITAATSIVNLLISDVDLQHAVIGMPSYLHSMTGFACVFLAQLATIYGEDLIDKNVVIEMCSRLVEIYRASSVGKWHLANLMANGLEKIVQQLSNISTASASQVPQDNSLQPFDLGNGFGDMNGMSFGDDGSFTLNPNFLHDYNMSMGATQLMSLSSVPTPFDTNDLSPTFLS